MSKNDGTPRTRAQPSLEFLPAALNPWLLGTLKNLLPLWLKLNTNVASIQAEGIDALADLYHQFQSGKIRLLIAFRHPSLNDSSCLNYVLWHLMPKAARRQGITLKPPIHVHYLYDRGITLWAGNWIGWLFPRLGCTPIRRGTWDAEGLKAARDLFANGRLPMAVAPEGIDNGQNQFVNPLEPGVAIMGFWCVEDLRKAGRSEEVLIVPIGIQYRYMSPPWAKIETLLDRLDVESGLVGAGERQKRCKRFHVDRPDTDRLYRRIVDLADHLLSMLEAFYQRFYHQRFPDTEALFTGLAPVSSGADQKGEVSSLKEHSLVERTQRLLHVALNVAEQYFNLEPIGNTLDRCHRIEQAAWNAIYRQELQQGTFSSVEQALADLVAEEASLRLWHIKIAEKLEAITSNYLQENPTAERFADIALLLWYLVTRMRSGDPFKPPQLGPQQAMLAVGEPLSVSQRWESFKRDRRQGIADLTEDLQTALEKILLID